MGRKGSRTVASRMAAQAAAPPAPKGPQGVFTTRPSDRSLSWAGTVVSDMRRLAAQNRTRARAPSVAEPCLVAARLFEVAAEAMEAELERLRTLREEVCGG